MSSDEKVASLFRLNTLIFFYGLVRLTFYAIAARRVGNSIYLFLRDKLRLPINQENSGISRRPSTFYMSGYGLAPVFCKGSKEATYGGQIGGILYYVIRSKPANGMTCRY